MSTFKATPEKQAAFCAALVAAGGNVTKACKAVDIDRCTPYRWRDENADFAAAWAAAEQHGADVLEDEARRRAHDGVPEPVWHMGVQVGTVQKYSDTLAIFLLKGAKPDKYRDNSKVELSGRLDVNRLSDAELEEEIARLEAAERALAVGQAKHESAHDSGGCDLA